MNRVSKHEFAPLHYVVRLIIIYEIFHFFFFLLVKTKLTTRAVILFILLKSSDYTIITISFNYCCYNIILYHLTNIILFKIY